MTHEELEELSNNLSSKTGLNVIFWYTAASYIPNKIEDYLIENIKEEDKTYYIVIKDGNDPVDSKIYFRTYSTNWVDLYETAKQILRLLKYEID